MAMSRHRRRGFIAILVMICLALGVQKFMSNRKTTVTEQEVAAMRQFSDESDSVKRAIALRDSARHDRQHKRQLKADSLRRKRAEGTAARKNRPDRKAAKPGQTQKANASSGDNSFNQKVDSY